MVDEYPPKRIMLDERLIPSIVLSDFVTDNSNTLFTAFSFPHSFLIQVHGK